MEVKVSRKRKVRKEILPIITGALGIIKKGLDRNL
jgi:hypothetical protein